MPDRFAPITPFAPIDPSEKIVVPLNRLPDRSDPIKLTPVRFTPEKFTLSFDWIPEIQAFVPDRFAPNVPSEKIVVPLKVLPDRSDPIKLTPLRFTPEKFTLSFNWIPEITAFVPDRFAPNAPSQNTVVPLNRLPDKSDPIKLTPVRFTPEKFTFSNP